MKPFSKIQLIHSDLVAHTCAAFDRHLAADLEGVERRELQGLPDRVDLDLVPRDLYDGLADPIDADAGASLEPRHQICVEFEHVAREVGFLVDLDDRERSPSDSGVHGWVVL
jgi:hypothetical protein